MSEKESLQDKLKESVETADKFSQIFYKKLDMERHAIDKLYLDTATLSWNGNCIEGGENIKKFILTQLPSTEHNLQCLDSQPLPDQAVGGQTTVMVSASGTVRYDKKSAVPFQQNFLITEKDMKWKIAVDTFRSQ